MASGRPSRRKPTMRGFVSGSITFVFYALVIGAVMQMFFGVTPWNAVATAKDQVSAVLGKPSTAEADLAKSVTAQAAVTDQGKSLIAQNYTKEEFLTDRRLNNWLRQVISRDGYTPSVAQYVAFYKQTPNGKLPPRYDNSSIPPGVILDVHDTGLPVGLIQEYGDGRGMACYAGKDSSRVDLAIAWPGIARVVWGLSMGYPYDIKADDSRLAHPLPDTLKTKVEGGKVVAGVSCYAFKV